MKQTTAAPVRALNAYRGAEVQLYSFLTWAMYGGEGWTSRSSRLSPWKDPGTLWMVGQDSSVGIATRRGLDGPVIESRWEGRFSAPVHTVPGAHQPPIQRVPGLSRNKAPGCGFDHPLLSSAEVKEREELYLHSTSGTS